MSIKLEMEFRLVQAQLAEQAEVIARLETDVRELQRLVRAVTREALPNKGKAA